MNLKRIGLSLLLADFLGLTAYVVYQHGFVGLFELVLANSATTLAFIDLVIALSMVMVWMARDARRRGVSAMPYLLLTAGLGSAGPLLYLLLREEDEERVPVARAAARA